LWFWCSFAHPPSRVSGKGGLRSPLSWRCVPVPLLGGVCGRSQQWLRQQAWLCCWQQRALRVPCSACQVSVSAQATRALRACTVPHCVVGCELCCGILSQLTLGTHCKCEFDRGRPGGQPQRQNTSVLITATGWRCSALCVRHSSSTITNTPAGHR
jgi:hypothetical protein